MENKNCFNVYCLLESVDVDADGNIHLILSKDSKINILNVCRILRESFVNKDVKLVFDYLKGGN